MSKSYPIWNNVKNCSYKSSKSYGNKRTGEVDVFVGSGAKNSHLLVKHITTKRMEKDFKYKGKIYEYVHVFTFGINFENGNSIRNIELAKKYFTVNPRTSGVGNHICTKYIKGKGL